MCLLGNKCDLENERQVKKEDAQEYAASIDSLFFETSALTNIGKKANKHVELGVIHRRSSNFFGGTFC